MEALIGLGGVLVGAAVAAGVAWWTRREAQRDKSRIAARLLLGEASALRLQLAEARERSQVLPDAGDHARRFLDAWRERPAELSGLPIEVWGAVTMGVHDLYMLADEADRASGQPWSASTDDLYRRLEELLGVVEELVRSFADDSLARSR